MNDEQFRAFLDLIMCSDPWPVFDYWGARDDKSLALLRNLATDLARKRGYADWIDAHRYHMK
jgi:hypothetical protein